MSIVDEERGSSPESDRSSRILNDMDDNCRPTQSQEVMDDEETASVQSEDSYLFYLNKKINNNDDNVKNAIKRQKKSRCEKY